jgi:site-specific DNA-methyltransferase (adenine-specific)
MIELLKGDCLEVMKEIKSESIDAIICDPPYGTTACKWDSVIDFKLMWEQLNRIIKPNGAIVLFGSEPFSSALRMSNIKNYKYELIWKKSKCGSPFTAKYKPLTKHENISIFEKKGNKTTYNPQMLEGKPYKRKWTPNKKNNMKYGIKGVETDNKGTRHPDCILDFQQKWRRQDQVHPTQKPVLLMEYLIKTYTNENETVLDFTMGSGTTGVGCVNLNRQFIGIEQDENYYNIAVKRLEEAKKELNKLTLFK